jgi:hypothetical protein
MSILPADERQNPRRRVLDDRIFHTVEIRPARFPVLQVSDYRDDLVGLEFDEFEGAGADRVAAHVARRNVAGIDRRPARRQ